MSFIGQIFVCFRNSFFPQERSFNFLHIEGGIKAWLIDSLKTSIADTTKTGTITSICPRCFLNAGFAHDESQLSALELKHVCDPDEECFISSLIDSASPPGDRHSA
jgi:hypothetical protein